VGFCIFLIPAVFYILTLQRALTKCSDQTRTMQPGMVWLLLVPLVSMIWSFFVVMALAKSLGAEFARRGIPMQDPLPGQSIGLAMCISICCCMIPIVNLLAGVASLVLWIMYWIKIADFSKMLDVAPIAAIPVPPPAPIV